jgi:hypothetical protein
MRLGFDLVEILTDGERIPYADPIVKEARTKKEEDNSRSSRPPRSWRKTATKRSLAA